MEKNAYVISIPMPFTGESIVDGILVSWHVKPGDHVEKGQKIAEIETEKSVWEFEAPCNGEITELKCAEGDVVDVGAPLLEVRTEDPNMAHLEKNGTGVASPKLAPSKLTPHNGADRTRTADGAAAAAAGLSTVPRTDRAPAAPGAEKTRPSAAEILRGLSPRLKKMVRDNEIRDEDLCKIEGSGPDGKLTAEDIGRYLDELEAKRELSGGALRPCYINGIGTYTPAKVVENDLFLAHFSDLSSNYIEQVTGIRERRWSENESTSDLAVQASRAALDVAGISASTLDLIIVATTTPDMPLPATACAVQQKLGCTAIPAFDVAAACSGWLYALSIGRQFIQSGVYDTVLVVASEVMSKFTDKTDRATAFLFGDGAGAAVLSASSDGEGSHELSEITMQADSSGYDIINRKAGGSSLPPGSSLAAGDEYWFMDGGRMFRSAVTTFSDIIETVAAKAAVALEEFRWIVPHQANRRILKSVAHRLGLPIERFFFNIDKYGNTSSASIPLCLKDLEQGGMLVKGDRLLLCAVGAGLTIAGGVVTW